jgi:prevent-host-death family protein
MKTVGIADLKARLSEHLRMVRRGRTLTVVDRDRPVAVLSPIESGALDVRRATRRAADLPKARPIRGTDSVAVLLADRTRR